MQKKIFASIAGCMLAGLMAYSGYRGCIAYENEGTSDLLLANAEALSASSETDGERMVFRLCGIRPDNDYCTAKRGHRRWAIDLVVSFGHVDDIPACPDQNYDYNDD